MSARAIEGAPEMGHLQPHYQGHDSVSRAVLAAVRISVIVFSKTVLPFVIVTALVFIVSPTFSNVFTDQPVSSPPPPTSLAAASLIPGTGKLLPKPPTMPSAPQKSKYKVEYVESPIMAWSRMIHEDTSTMRSQLNSPLPTALDLTNYPGVNRRIYAYQQSLVWNGTVNKAQIGIVMLVIVFVLVLPWVLMSSGLVRPRRVLSVVIMAVLAVFIAAQPLALMTAVQASKAFVVDKSFRGDAFESLQYASQQELVDKPAAQVALGPAGLNPRGVDYITALHNGDPVVDKDIVTFNKVHPNPVKSNAVASFSLLRAIIDADLQRPPIMLAVGIETAINVVMNPVTIVIVLLLMIASTVSLAFKRHVKGFVGLAAALYTSLALSVLLVTGPALASLWLGRVLDGASIGPLTTILGAFGALGIIWAYRCTVIEVVKRTRWVLATSRARKTLPSYNSGLVISGTVVNQPKKSRRSK